MHILHVLNTLGAGGAEAYVVHVSNDLIGKGAKVTVVAGQSNMTLAGQLSGAVEIVTIEPPVGGRVGPVSSVSNLLREAPKLARMLHSSGITVIHSHLIASGLPFWLAGRLAGVPSLHTAMHVRGVASRSEKLAYDSRIPGRVVNRFLALSDWFREEMVHKWHIPRSRIETIRSGVDVTRFQPDAAKRAQSRAAWAVEPDALVCGAAARLHPGKGLDLAIQSAAHAIRNGAPNLVFAIAGTGEQEEELRGLAAREGIARQVLFLGYESDTSRILPGFDIYLQTTIGPNLGFSSLEALNSGIPLLIAARSPQERAMAEDTLTGDGGGWVEDATPAAMGARLLQLYGNRNLLAGKKLLARDIGVTHYNWDSHVKRLVRLYEEMATG